MSRNTMALLLLIATLLLCTAGIATLVPWNTKMMSDLGYFSACPFAPWSTLTLLILGGICYSIRQHIRRLPRA